MGILLDKWLIAAFLVFMGSFTSPSIVVQEEASSYHPYYVSVFEFSHNATEKSMEITTKIFSDDFEAALKKHSGTVVDLGNESQKANLEKIMGEYINKNLQLTIDGKLQPMKFLGFEKEKESVYCYLEIANVPSVKRLDVKNTMLYDQFKEQANIMHIIVGGSRKSYKLDYPKDQTSFIYN